MEVVGEILGCLKRVNSAHTDTRIFTYMQVRIHETDAWARSRHQGPGGWGEAGSSLHPEQHKLVSPTPTAPLTT